MYKIQTLNAISQAGLRHLNPESFQIGDDMRDPEGIILRSYDMHSMDLPKSLLGIARAGAGTNNIPVDACAKKGIVVFNTPGANANAVKELVILGLLISSRKVVQGIEWVNGLRDDENIEKLVEKGKSQFVGPEIDGKTLGVIGLGAIGVMVANVAYRLGMKVIGYDPYISVDAAWHMSRHVNRAASMEELVANSDYVTIHVPLNAKTRGLYDEKLFAATKPGARLLNLARGELVDAKALEQALSSGTIASYVTDFPTKEVAGLPNVILIPHLGASTPESEENCAEMAAMELKNFLEYGNIKNSVNFPDCEAPYTGKVRIAITNENKPNMVSSVASVFAAEGINIDNMLNKSRGDYAYTLLDVDTLCGKGEKVLAELLAIDGVTSARIVREA